MKTYHHTKSDLAIAVARNQSKFSNQPIWVFSTGIKSIPTMKYIDTTVIQVAAHHEMPLFSGMAIALFHKGKKKVIQ